MTRSISFHIMGMPIPMIREKVSNFMKRFTKPINHLNDEALFCTCKTSIKSFGFGLPMNSHFIIRDHFFEDALLFLYSTRDDKMMGGFLHSLFMARGHS